MVDAKIAKPDRVSCGGGIAGVKKAWDLIGKLRIRSKKKRDMGG